MMIAFYETNWLSWILIVLAQRINSPRLDMSNHSDTLSWLQTNQSLLSPWCYVLSGEETNTNLIVFGLTQPVLEPTIYWTLGEHAIHYITDAV
jgi:hypothetical protein